MFIKKEKKRNSGTRVKQFNYYYIVYLQLSSEEIIIIFTIILQKFQSEVCLFS